MKEVTKIAFYLPQFYPIRENDEWWGDGFTEWTNVRNAKPLFKGHYQPRVPSSLGYYDLRDVHVRVEQAKLAKEAGIDGFCYWHYWFEGKRLLDMVFNEVVHSGTPDFPFCLCWANHSWKKKSWQDTKEDKMLIEQTYGGVKDYENQFYSLRDAFMDERYIKIEGKPLFGIFEPSHFTDFELFAKTWNNLAIENGFPGFCFFGFAQGVGSLGFSLNGKYDLTVYDAMYDAVYEHLRGLLPRLKARLCEITGHPYPLQYSKYTSVALKRFSEYPDTVPCIIPNFDHSPRSGNKGVIITDNTPAQWADLCRNTIKLENVRNNKLLFIKAWNEWGEGNYLEPDEKFGKEYITQTGLVFRE